MACNNLSIRYSQCRSAARAGRFPSGVPFPGLKPLGCFLFALRALGTRTIQKQDRIMLPAGLDILGRPKGENRIAQRLQPWEDVPERNCPARAAECRSLFWCERD